MSVTTPITAMPAPPIAPFARRPDILHRAVDTGMTVFFVYRALPETIVERAYLGATPLDFVVFYACLLIGAAAVLVSSIRRDWVPLLVIVGLAGVYMLAIGLARETEVHFLAIDVTFYLGLAFGIVWAAQRDTPETIRTIRRWFFISGFILLFNVIGLMVGFVPAARDVSRSYTYSLFHSCIFLSSLFPLVFATATVGNKGVGAKSTRWLSVLVMAIVLSASVFTATRSTFITAAFSLGTVTWVTFNAKAAIRFALCLVVIGTVVGTTGERGWWRNDPMLADRLATTYLDEEVRFEELLWMFDDLRGNMLVGKGFGSRFASPIGNLDGYAFMPHIGILALVYKGGLILFTLLVVVPLARSAFGLTRRVGVAARRHSSEAITAACYAGILTYAVQSSMSSGWSASALFVCSSLYVLATCPIRLGTRVPLSALPHHHHQTAGRPVRPSFNRRRFAATRPYPLDRTDLSASRPWRRKAA